jgi:ribosomal-protein-alanine N-acetyltransferase
LPLRDATPADIEDLALLETRIFPGDRLSPRSFRRLAGAPSAALRVLVEGGRLAGYALTLFRRGSRRARLYSIAVDRGARGTGAGRRLLADAERVARQRGARILSLEVRIGNRPAIGLYRKAGYREQGRVDGYYEDGATAIRFAKALAGSRLR